MPYSVQETFRSSDVRLVCQREPKTSLCLLSEPVASDPFAVRFTIRSFDQGSCSNPADGSWSWFEVSIIRPVQPDRTEAPSTPQGHRRAVADFRTYFENRGWGFVTIAATVDKENLGETASPNVQPGTSTLLAQNIAQPALHTHVVQWNITHDVEINRNNVSFLKGLRCGDRIAVWARVKFAGWINWVQDLKVEVFSMPIFTSLTTDLFGIDADMRETVRAMDEEELSNFVDIYQESDGPEDMEVGVFARVLLTAKIPSRSNIDLAVQRAEEWLALPLRDDKNDKRRQDVLDTLIAQRLEWEMEGDGKKSLGTAPWTVCPPLSQIQILDVDALVSQLKTQFEQTSNLGDLDTAIKFATVATTFVVQEKQKLAQRFWRLGLLLGIRYQEKAEPDGNDLDRSIGNLATAIEHTQFDDPWRPDRLKTLSNVLCRRYQRSRSQADIVRAITTAVEATELTSGAPDNASAVLAQASAHLTKFKVLQHSNDLARATDLAMQATETFDFEHLEDSEFIAVAAGILAEGFKQHDKIAHLERAVQITRRGADSLLLDAPQRSKCLVHHAKMLCTRYQRFGEKAVLDAAIDALKEALYKSKQALPAAGTARKEHLDLLHDLSMALLWRIQTREYGNDFISLATTLSPEIQHEEHDSDLEDAYRFIEQALTDRALDPLARLRCLATRIGLLISRYHQSRDIDTLNEAIEIAENILTYQQPTPFERLGLMIALGEALWMRMDGVTEIDDPGCANQLRQDTDRVNLLAKDIPVVLDHQNDLSSSYGGRIARWFLRRFERWGYPQDLSEAVKAADSSFSLTPSDHSQYLTYQHILALLLLKRFEYAGTTADLYRSIELAESFLAATPPGEKNHARQSLTLACALYRRYLRNNNFEDLYRAAALAETERNHGLMGLILISKFERTFALQDIDDAILNLRSAVDLTAPQSTDRARWTYNLGTAHAVRWEIGLHDDDDLNLAIINLESAIDQYPQGHPELGVCLEVFGKLYMRRAILHENDPDQHSTQTDQERAFCNWNRCFNSTDFAPLNRLKAGIDSARVLAALGDWTKSMEIYAKALELLPLVSLRALDKPDQLRLVRQFAGVASEAAEAMLYAGDAARALSALESGRGIVANHLSNIRSDTTELRQNHPDLAEQFDKLCGIIAAPRRWGVHDARHEDSSFIATQADEMRNAYSALEDLAQSIRKLPGFEHFLRPLLSVDVLAKRGPFIIINAGDWRSDAFLVMTDHIHICHLPKLKLRDVSDKVAALANPDAMTAILEWMWDVIADPVLNALGILEPPADDNWPHVWWVPTGPLGHFPLHAAGYHLDGSNNTVLDRVMSSYSSSLKAVMVERRNDVDGIGNNALSEAVLVAMSKTPGLKDLPYAAPEVEMLEGLCPSLNLHPNKPPTHRNNVLEQLAAAKVFHFAGHGKSDPVDPSQSCLLLSDGENEPLTVEDLYDRNFRSHGPFLGYLSACSTGANKDAALVDESAHLIRALQLTGFRHVIGTLWDVQDKLCVDVARIVYETLHEDGMTDDSVCFGLHKALRALREAQRARILPAAQGDTRDGSCLPFDKESFKSNEDTIVDNHMSTDMERQPEMRPETHPDDVNALSRLVRELTLDSRGFSSVDLGNASYVLSPDSIDDPACRDPGKKRRRLQQPTDSIKAHIWAPYVHYVGVAPNGSNAAFRPNALQQVRSGLLHHVADYNGYIIIAPSLATSSDTSSLGGNS